MTRNSHRKLRKVFAWFTLGVLVAMMVVPQPALAAYQSSDVLGQDDFTTGTANATALTEPNEFGLFSAADMVLDSVNHRLFVADSSNNRVLEFDLDSSNVPLDYAADHVLGQADFTSNSQNATQSGLHSPIGLAYDSVNARLFVVDNNNNRTLVFDVGSITDGENAVNVIGQTDYTSSASATTQNRFFSPGGVSYDATNNRLFVAELGNNRITVFDVDPAVLIPNNAGTDGPNAINVIGASNFTTVGFGATQHTLETPYFIAYDSINDRLFVAEENNNRITVFDVDPAVLIPNNAGTDGPNAINVIGQTNFTSNGHTLTQSGLWQPIGVGYDSNNERLFVVDGSNNRITVYDVDPAVLIPNNPGSNGPNAINVIGQPDFTSNTNAATQSGVSIFGNVGYDTDNEQLFAADTGNHRVTVYDVDPSVLIPNNSGTDGPNAINVIGQTDGTSPVYTTSQRDNLDNSPISMVGDRGFSAPVSTTLDTVHHRLFVVDANNNRVLEFDLDSDNNLLDYTADHVLGQTTFETAGSALTQNGFSTPQGVAYDSVNDRLFVSEFDNDRVTVFDVSSITDGENAINVIGQANFTTNGGATTQKSVSSPVGLAYDSTDDRLFVADRDQNRVMVFDVDPAVLIADVSLTDNPDAINVLGHTAYDGSDTPTEFNGFSAEGLALDVSGHRLFVGDELNNRVLVFDVLSITNGENAVNLLGHTAYDGSDTPTGQNGFITEPVALAYDATRNRLFVSDDGANRVTVFDVASITDGEDATAVIGQDDFDSSTPGTTQNTLNTPAGMAYDGGNNRLYIADIANNRIIIDDFITITDDIMPGGILDTPYSQEVPTEDGQGSLDFSIVSGSLPSGLSLNSSSGEISGTPTTPGTATFTIRVEDEDDYGIFADERQMTLQVFAAGGYLASDAIGQLGSDGNPLFTTSDVDGGVDPRGFNRPFGQAVDAVHHRIFVADAFNNRVLVFNLAADNQVVDYVADFVLGQPDLKIVTAGTTQSTLSGPRSLAYDSVGDRLFVGDGSNSRVLVFDVSTITNGMDAENVLGYSTFDSSDLPTNQNEILTPAGLVYDEASKRLFVSDFSQDRVVVFNADPAVLIPNTPSTDGPNAINVIGQADYASDDDSAAQNRLRRPAGLAYDPTRQLLFVADNGNGSFHNRVMVFDVDPAVLIPGNTGTDGPNAVNVLGHTLFDGSDTPTDQNRTQQPSGLAYDDASKRLFVASEIDNSIRVFDLDTIVDGEDAINVLGQANFTDTVSATTAAGLSQPEGLSYDSASDSLFVSEFGNNRILIFDGSSIDDGDDAVNVLGQYAQGTSFVADGINNSPDDEGFNSIYDVAIDVVHHRAFTSDANARILVFNLDSSNNLIDHTADFVLGQPDFKMSGTGATAQNNFSAELRQIAYDPVHDRLFAADGGIHRVLVFDVSSITNGENASNVIGQVDFTTDTTDTSPSGFGFGGPWGVAYDSVSDRLFVGDSGNNRVMVFDVDPSVLIADTPSTDGPNAINVIGQPNFTSNTPNTTQDGLNSPQGVLYREDSDQLFVADGGGRVMVFNVDPGVLIANTPGTDGPNAINVLGHTDFNGTVTSSDEGNMSDAFGLAYDSSNSHLFVSDDAKNRVLMFDIESITNGEDAVAVLGQPSFAGNSTNTTQTGLSNPAGISFDPGNKRIYIADFSNNRVEIYDFVKIITDTLPDAVQGDFYDEDILTDQDQGIVGFSLASGSLPPGLIVGSVSGTPTTPGTYTFTVRATDDNGTWGIFTDIQEYTLTVAADAGGGGGSGGGGGGFIPPPGFTPAPAPTPPPTVGGVVIQDGGLTTMSRYVKLTYNHPFDNNIGVSTRTANADDLTPLDRDIVAAYTARGGTVDQPANISTLPREPNSTTAPVLYDGANITVPEISAGSVRSFVPEVFSWDLCGGAPTCTPGTYQVFAQFTRATSGTPTALTALGDEVSLLYTDSIVYAPLTPPVPPAPPAPPSGGPSSGPSGATPTPIPPGSPVPSASPAPSGSPAPVPSVPGGPSASGPSLPFISTSASNVIGEGATLAAPVVVAVTTVPVLVALAAALASGNAVAFTMFMFQSLLEIFGLKKRARVWGTIYDAKTKHPIAFAKIELRDQANRVLEIRYADRDGRYGFLTSPASLQQQTLQCSMVPSAKGYIFPTTLVTTDPDFLVYNHVYRGGIIAIGQDALVNYNIPLDPSSAHPAAAAASGVLAHTSAAGEFFLDVAFWIGVVILPLNAYLHPTWFSIGLLIVFGLANAIRIGAHFYRPYGSVRDARTGEAIPYALVTLNELTGTRISFAVSDERGRYFLLAPPGSYLLTVNTPAQVQPSRSRSIALSTKKGWVTQGLDI